ncbi:UNVERIFIED_CONTAM: hypothetical protein K2H54_021439 [Gekko kuhli]
MTLSSFEVALQTMATGLSDYLEDKNGVLVFIKNGLNQMVKEQFPHCEKCPLRKVLTNTEYNLIKTKPALLLPFLI